MDDATPNAKAHKDLFPVPKHFMLSPVKDGAYHRGLPTVTAVYANMALYPEGIFLMGMTNVSIDPHDTDECKLLLNMFIQPEWDDEEIPADGITVFSEACGFELQAEKQNIDEFMESAQKIKAFTLAVSTDEFYFSCRVDFDTTEVSNVRCDWRYLH